MAEGGEAGARRRHLPGASRRRWARDLGMGIRFQKAGGSALREREAEVLLF
jgi:hypothetical protein